MEPLFRPLHFKDQIIGNLYENDFFLFFFGHANAPRALLNQVFDDYVFPQIKQVHGDGILIHSARSSLGLDHVPEADAHLTKDRSVALPIITADCIPALFVCQKTGWIAAAHAGWRGVANQILKKTLRSLILQGASAEHIQVFLGPHIGFGRFEVHAPVAQALRQSVGESSELLRTHSEPEKYYVHLAETARRQLVEEGLERSQIVDFSICTFDNQEYASYRRDGPKSGRQISFVVRK